MEAVMGEIEPTRVLVEKAQAGSRAAFEELLTVHQGRLEALIHSLLGPELRGKVEAADVRQETLLRAFESIEKFRWSGEGCFLGWLGGIAEHVVLKQVERWKVRRVSPLQGDIAASDISPSRGLRREDRFARLREAIQGLSPDHRQVIRLARIEKLPSSEIARLMNRSPAAVAQLLSRALKKLREAFGDTESLHLPPQSLEIGGSGEEA
jgi:RNA polymerase sigma-70 factor (ECF subfamily)